MNVIDLFCGCGGLSQGFIDAGFNIVIGIDNWSDAIETFNYNHKNSKGIVADLLNIDPQEIKTKYNIESVDLIIGGPPCQGFSIAGKRIIDDERNQLYKSFLRFVDYFKPKGFVMENVPNILSMGNGVIKNQILKDFEDIGYNITYDKLLASDFAVPQNRMRAFFVGLKDSLGFEYPKPITTDNKITSEEAISDLPKNSLEDGYQYPINPKSVFQREMRNGNKVVFNHQITNHNEKTVEIIAMVPDGE
ncbi:MAG: DNA cytosine methyltransferase [Marinicella sp.]